MSVTSVTNTVANYIQGQLKGHNAKAAQAAEEMASGRRQGDSSSSAIAARLGGTIDVLGQAGINTANAASLIQVVDGALDSTYDLLTQMKSLTTKANSDMLSASDKALAQQDFEKLSEQVDFAANTLNWNGVKLLTGTGGTATASGAVTMGQTGFTAVANGFAATLNAASSGLIDGIASAASVTANGSLFDVSVSVGSQTFKATVATPTAGGTLALVSTTDSTNKIVLDYDGTAITGIDTVAEFDAGLKTLLGVNTASKAVFTSLSTAANNGVSSIAAGSNTEAGTYALTYAANSNQLRLTDGKQVLLADVVAGAQTATFNNGVTVTTGAGFALGTGVTQMVFKVDQGNTTNMSFQAAGSSSDTLSITINGATLAALGLSGTDISTKSNAASAGLKIDSAMDSVLSQKARLGAQLKQFESQQENLHSSRENFAAAKSSFVDVDTAEKVTEYMLAQVRSNIANSMLTQANKEAQKQVELVRAAG
jgi:flagellin